MWGGGATVRVYLAYVVQVVLPVHMQCMRFCVSTHTYTSSRLMTFKATSSPVSLAIL